MISYKLRRDNLFDEDFGNYTAYGIDVFKNSSVLIRSVPDISFDKSALSNLIYRSNNNHLDLIHLDDIIYDFIG